MFEIKFVFPATLVVLKVEGPPYVCRTDEVGEICASADSAATG